MPVGSLIGGVLGQLIGVRQTVWIGAVGMLFCFLPVFLSPLRTMRELPRHTGEEAGMMAT
jgi:predicted MFS family arabinose efflux permease